MKPITTIAAVLLGLIALVQLLRLVFGWGLVINETLVPMWLSVVVLLVFASVAVMPCWTAQTRLDIHYIH